MSIRTFGKAVKRISRKVVKYTLLGVGALTIAVSLIVYALLAARGGGPYIKHNTVLVLSVDGALPDYASASPWAVRFLGAPAQSLTGLGDQLKKAKVDARIGGVIVDIRSFEGGWAKADELRASIFDFETSGKPTYAYIETNSDKEYYIAAACQRIYIAPVGELAVDGLDAEAKFYRGTLDKFGVYFDNYQIGKYKTAPEQYTRRAMSEGQREVTNSLIDDQFARYTEVVAVARNKTPEEVRALIDGAPYPATDALKLGLVDGVAYREGVENIIKKKLLYKDYERLPLISVQDYSQVPPESLGLNKGERIAVIYASGAIGPGRSAEGALLADPVAGSDTLVRAIEDACDDKTVKAIVLRVDSPGGTTTASDLIWGAVTAAKEKKPVVVSMGDYATSGGYYISANASRIVAEPSTLTGSVGVYANKPVLKGLYDMIGVTTDHIARGKNAGFFRDSEPFTAAERAQFEAKLNKFYYDEFLPKVAQGRKLEVGFVDSIAQGRVWSGAQAKERGLVDEFGGLDRAVEVAKELANIPRDKGVERVIYPAPRTFLAQVLGTGDKADAGVQQQQAMLSVMPEELRPALKYFLFFDRVKRGETLAMMPYELEIK